MNQKQLDQTQTQSQTQNSSAQSQSQKSTNPSILINDLLNSDTMHKEEPPNNSHLFTHKPENLVKRNETRDKNKVQDKIQKVFDDSECDNFGGQGDDELTMEKVMQVDCTYESDYTTIAHIFLVITFVAACSAIVSIISVQLFSFLPHEILKPKLDDSQQLEEDVVEILNQPHQNFDQSLNDVQDDDYNQDDLYFNGGPQLGQFSFIDQIYKNIEDRYRLEKVLAFVFQVIQLVFTAYVQSSESSREAWFLLTKSRLTNTIAIAKCFLLIQIVLFAMALKLYHEVKKENFDPDSESGQHLIQRGNFLKNMASPLIFLVHTTVVLIYSLMKRNDMIYILDLGVQRSDREEHLEGDRAIKEYMRLSQATQKLKPQGKPKDRWQNINENKKRS